MQKIIILIFTFYLYGCDNYQRISGGYMVESESKSSTKITNINKKRINSPKGIPCTVISYEYDDDFIIALQKKNDCFNNSFDENKEVYFWIINIKKDTLIGPLEVESYLKIKDSLGVSSDLKIKL